MRSKRNIFNVSLCNIWTFGGGVMFTCSVSFPEIKKETINVEDQFKVVVCLTKKRRQKRSQMELCSTFMWTESIVFQTFALSVQINLNEQETKESPEELISVVAVYIPLVLLVGETNKHGQLDTKGLVWLWEQTAEGFIRGNTDYSLNVKHFAGNDKQDETFLFYLFIFTANRKCNDCAQSFRHNS